MIDHVEKDTEMLAVDYDELVEEFMYDWSMDSDNAESFKVVDAMRSIGGSVLEYPSVYAKDFMSLLKQKTSADEKVIKTVVNEFYSFVLQEEV